MAVLQRTVTNVSSNNPQPIIGEILPDSQPTIDKFYSSKLLNYIESFEIGGILKTVFFTEVNTNINLGDRVFILNGNYDSNNFIKGNKYKKFSDGYRVLSINGCRIILDIDYTGDSPTQTFTSRDFIYIHVIDNQKDFDYINSLKISLDGSSELKSIFSGNIIDGKLHLGCQNILYVTESFEGSSSSTNTYGDVTNSGFWVRVDDGVNNKWIEVSFYIVSNAIIQNSLFSNSGKLYIKGKDFEFDEMVFESKGIYSYVNYEWVIDVTSYPAFISKLNFRSGKFLGIHNDGIYGTYNKKLNWNGGEWNSGVMINSIWQKGLMNSKHTIEEESFICKIQKIGNVNTVVQTLDNTNNRGFGYNFIEDSDFISYNILNGNFYDCNFIDQNNNKSSVEIYYSLDSQHQNLLNGGRYEFCEINDSTVNNVTIINSLVDNSNLRNSKIISTEVIESVIDDSNWSSDAGIRIVGAEIQSYDFGTDGILGTTNNDILGTIKLYISEEDYFKLSYNDTFYISQLNKETIFSSLSDESKILHPLENRYLIDNYDDYELNNGDLTKMFVSVKSTSENRFKSSVKTSSETIDYFDFVLNAEDASAWYKIPVFMDESVELIPQLRFNWDFDYANNIGYILGDFVYMGSLTDFFELNFYQYWPINKGDVSDGRIGSRAEPGNFQQADDYGRNYREFSPQDFNETPWGSDWIWCGIYSGIIPSPTMGIWDKNASYLGGTIPETTVEYYSPPYPFGQVVRDNDIDSNFFIFIGEDIGLTNSTKEVLIGVDYLSQNTVTQSTINFPSIDITSSVFGFYENFEGVVVPSYTNKINPINPSNINNLFTNTIIRNGDFKSGLMVDSIWSSGDHTNPQDCIIKKLDSENLDITLIEFFSKKILKVSLSDKKLSQNINYTYRGYDFEVGDHIWINSIIYYTLGSSASVTPISGRYKIIRYFKNLQEIWLESNENIDKLMNLETGGFFKLPTGNTNNYLSIYKSFFDNTTFLSGKLRRSGLKNCNIENNLFKKYVYPNSDLNNSMLMRLINIMFQDTGNSIKSGLVFKSHFVNDEFNGGTLYYSHWLGGTFSDGLFKSSVWTGGNFNGGKFVDSRSSEVFNFDYDIVPTNKLWQGGNFNDGEFFNSLWVRGNFNGGKFFFSDWTGGTWSNGILGDKKFRPIDTTMAYFGPTTSFGATHTIWLNGLVENAILGGFGSIDWFGGKMNGGEFTSEGLSSSNYSTWHGGDFYGSSFTKQARWMDGNFYSGKFLSEVGWEQVSFLSHTNSQDSYGWVNGNFYGGEFGNGSKLANSVWYDGIMSGGVFKGRFWRNGLLTNGKFYGSLVTQSDISISLLQYTQSFYGLWNDGQVNSVIYDVKRDLIVTTQETDVSSKRVRPLPKIVDMFDIIWRNGTFSHELSTFNNSLWLNGQFNSGNFNNSYFNPFVDLTLQGLRLEDYDKSKYLKQIYDQVAGILEVVDFITTPLASYLDNIQSIIEQFNKNTQVNTNFRIEYFIFEGYYDPIPPDYPTIPYEFDDYTQFDTSVKDLTVIARIYDVEVIKLIPNDYIGLIFYVPLIEENQEPGGQNRNLNLTDLGLFTYPNIDNWDNVPYSFNTSSTCVWSGGNFNSGEFNYSKWLDGNFNDGTMNGVIWIDGTFNYGFMNNCYWENGVWRNGNWNGSPFNHSNLTLNGQYWEVTNKRVDQILKNISNYTDNKKLHLSNVMITDPSLTNRVHTFDASDFVRWQVLVENQIQ